MEEISKHGRVGKAAMMANMDRKTARKYVSAGKLPSELKQPRTWRTRPDPFEEDWSWVEEQLRSAPELEAKTLFEVLQERHPGRYEEGQLRTLQRHMKQWRAQLGPEKEVFFSQQHRPGEAGQTDFTWAKELEVTIAGAAFVHMLCHFVLPFSNWQWVTVCLSESFLALKRGVQEAIFRLGRRPEWHQTDNTGGATHDVPSGKRQFNADYAALMRHLGMKPRTTAIGAKEQNGDVEAAHRALKRRLNQQLLLRGSRDFDTVEQYERWIWQVLEKANEGRRTKVVEELSAMRPVNAERLPECKELNILVSQGSTIRVLNNTYSVPSRLIGEQVRARVHEREIEVYNGNELQLVTERLRGRAGHSINYRHVICSLVRKPGAFARYRFREDLFPSVAFRRAYDATSARWPGTKGDLEYLKILHLAAATLESDVEAALNLLFDEERSPTAEDVKALVGERPEPAVPQLEEYQVDLNGYDGLLDLQEMAS